MKVERYAVLFFLSALLLGAQPFSLVNNFQVATVAYGSVGKVLKEVVVEKVVPETSVGFVGDVMLAREVERYQSQYGYDYPFSYFTDKNYDFLVGNFEGAIPEIHLPTENNQLQFSVNADVVPALVEAGFTHFSLANNHANDFGQSGLARTRQVLQEAEITPFGSYLGLTSENFTLIDTPSHKVAVLALNAFDNNYDPAVLRRTIELLESVSDIQIVYIHWGEEYRQTNSRSQSKLAHSMIDAGADMIIGHHPHVVQNIEVYKDVLIVYSLGNFVFDQYFSQEVQEGLVLELTLSPDNPRLQLEPVSSLENRVQPSSMTSSASEEFLSNLAARSDEVLLESITNGHIFLNDTLHIVEK